LLAERWARNIAVTGNVGAPAMRRSVTAQPPFMYETKNLI
jgi:hypothetical protein